MDQEVGILKQDYNSDQNNTKRFNAHDDEVIKECQMIIQDTYSEPLSVNNIDQLGTLKSTMKSDIAPKLNYCLNRSIENNEVDVEEKENIPLCNNKLLIYNRSVKENVNKTPSLNVNDDIQKVSIC